MTSSSVRETSEDSLKTWDQGTVGEAENGVWRRSSTHQHLQMGAHQLANGADPYFQFTRLPDEPASGSQSTVCEGQAAGELEGIDPLRSVHGLTRSKGGAFVGKCGHRTARLG